ncbi:MAG: hypothetical protein JWO94_1514 [Verrucomicrobiaceae bacterium]|nr:hypothetical protein [Verrucomicrobiaceae bacterium]
MITPSSLHFLSTARPFRAMIFTPKLQALALAVSLLLGTAASSNARSINWGSSVNDTLLYSAGGSEGDDVVFQLGSFGTFVPDTTNMSQWAANWNVFDQAVAPDGSGFNSSQGFVSGTVTVNSDGTSSSGLSPYIFSQGEQAYIWAYKVDKTLANGGEWALITNDSTDGSALDDWTFPAHADQTVLPLDWRLSNATDVIFGGLNSVQGPGDHNSNPVSFDLQLHTVVPEPGSALLACTALLGLGLRRRRPATAA